MTTFITPGRIALAVLCAASGSTWAVEYGTVISSTQVVASVPVPQRECTEEQRVYPQRSSGAGALIGAIAGAAIGNSIGSGTGRAAAAGLGMVAGSVIGDRIETEGTPAPTSIVQRCRTVTRLEQRTLGYDVVYEYQGVQRTARLAQDPGERVALDVAPVGALPAPARTAAVTPPQAYYSAPPVPDYDESRPPPRVVYVQPEYYQPPAYAYGWPHPIVGGRLWIGPSRGWHLGHGGRGGYYHPRR